MDQENGAAVFSFISVLLFPDPSSLVMRDALGRLGLEQLVQDLCMGSNDAQAESV